jgi:hypothetical protein
LLGKHYNNLIYRYWERCYCNICHDVFITRLSWQCNQCLVWTSYLSWWLGIGG